MNVKLVIATQGSVPGVLRELSEHTSLVLSSSKKANKKMRIY